MANPLIVTLTPENFEPQVLKSPRPVVVDFWAEWCGPCKMIAPILDELADEYQDTLTIGKVDVSAHETLAAQYRILAIPTLLIFKGGQVVGQIQGAKRKKDLKASIDQAIA
jgi:thioredoxin 1